MKNIRRRYHRFQSLIGQNRPDAVLLLDSAGIRYVTGVSAGNTCVLFAREQVKIFTDIVSYPMLKSVVSDGEVVCNGRSSWADLLTWMHRKRIRQCLVDAMKVPFGFILAARKIAPQVEWIDAGDRLEAIRAVKDLQETRWIADAVEGSLNALEEWIRRLRTGVTEKEAAAHMDRLLIGMTGEIPAFPAMVAFGKHSACPHWNGSGKQLKPGDTVLVDFGGRVEGYCADLTRVFFWRKATSVQLRRYRVVQETLETLIRLLKPGLKASAVAETVLEQMGARRLRPYSVHHPGHGIGLDVHESPYFCLDSEDVIMVNMVIALEPGIFIPGWGGIRLEETIRIDATGACNLANQPVMERPIL